MKSRPQSDMGGGTPNMGGKKKKVEDYEFGDVLGEGAFGAVVLGTDKETGKQFAIKMLDKKHIAKQNKIQYVHTERDILAKCKHPNIIKLFSTFQDKANLVRRGGQCALVHT